MDMLRQHKRTPAERRSRRRSATLAGPGSRRPAEYFRNSLSREVDLVREAKRQGKGVVGIYCEFTPRELILAAGAVPVCLCGATERTIPAAETVLPSNLCPLIKSSFGYIVTNSCPFLPVTDLVVAETTCDGKKKMYELLAEKHPVHILELTQKVDEQEAFGHWLAEVRKLKQKLERTFGRIDLRRGRVREAIKAMNRERGPAAPGLQPRQGGPGGRDRKRTGRAAVPRCGKPGPSEDDRGFPGGGTASARERGIFAAKKGAPRIMLTGCPTAQGTTKVIEIIEECGAVVAVQETCSGMKPLDLQVDESGDPLEAIARKYFRLPCSCMTPNSGRTELMERLAAEFRVNAVVDLVWQACHTYNVESYLVDRFVRGKLGMPYMKIETDYSDADRERLKVRIQTLVEML